MSCLSLFSCESTLGPLQVSQKFWQGIQNKNIALVRIYSVSDPKIKSQDLEKLPDITVVSFGKIIIDGNHAEIETNITKLVDNETINITVNTVLINKNGKWKVIYQKTMSGLTLNQDISEMITEIQDMAGEVAKEIEGSVGEIKDKALPEIKSKLEAAEQELREKIPEIKNFIDDLLKNIEKAIEGSFPEKQEQKTQET